MNIRTAVAIVVVFISVLSAQTADTVPPHVPTVLFMHDGTDKPSKNFIDAFKAHLAETGVRFDQAAAESTACADISPYEYIVIYSTVMAFTMMSPVKKWLHSVTSLSGKKIALFVTANRWMAGGHCKELRTLVEKRGGMVVDAVSMATNTMSPAQKNEAVKIQCVRLK